MPTGAFNLPLYKYQSTAGARREYAKTWSRDWPHDDKFLRLLAAEVEEKAKGTTEKKCPMLINAMREQHEFEDSAQSIPIIQ